MERIYESMLILQPDLKDEERENIFQKIIKAIEGLEGEVPLSKVWAKSRDLCYIIRSRGAEKKKHNKGLYWLINFTLDTQKISELKETIRLEERILRSIIFRKEIKKVSLNHRGR